MLNYEGLQSEEFQLEMQETIQRINEKFNMDIRCGLIMCGEDSLVIQIDARQA